MAYTLTQWKTGDTITADKLNNIESGIDKAQNGWEVTNDYTLVWEGDVPTVDTGNGYYSGDSSDTTFDDSFYNSVYDGFYKNPTEIIRVTLDGAEYVCNSKQLDGTFPVSYYGATPDANNATFDFSEYPFMLMLGEYPFFQTCGTHAMKIEALSKVYSIGDDYRASVNKVFEENVYKIDASAFDAASSSEKFDMFDTAMKMLNSNKSVIFGGKAGGFRAVYWQVNRIDFMHVLDTGTDPSYLELICLKNDGTGEITKETIKYILAPASTQE